MSRTYFLRKLTFIGALLAQLSVFGQDSAGVQHYLSVGHENDFLNAIGPHTDQYYTGGAFLYYGHYKKSSRSLADRILVAPGKPEYSFYRTGFSFWMYSPTDLKMHTAQTGDYPYSGTMFLDLSRETQPDPKTLFRSELWLGFTGPFAQGSWMQETLHKSMHFIIPRGWDNQLPISPLLNYNLYLEKNLASLSDHIHVNALGYAQMGSSQDAVKTGFRLVIANRCNDFFPSRVYAVNRSDNSRRLKFFADLTPAIKVVGYNSLIEGTIFSRKNYYHIPASQVERVVFEGSGGFGFRTRGFSFSYREIFETKEFKTVHQHVYGSLFITVRL
jgi:lipid A 3-O-deacylase